MLPSHLCVTLKHDRVMILYKPQTHTFSYHMKNSSAEGHGSNSEAETLNILKLLQDAHGMGWQVTLSQVCIPLWNYSAQFGIFTFFPLLSPKIEADVIKTAFVV